MEREYLLIFAHKAPKGNSVYMMYLRAKCNVGHPASAQKILHVASARVVVLLFAFLCTVGESKCVVSFGSPVKSDVEMEVT